MKPTKTLQSEIERELNSQGISVTWEEFPYDIPNPIPGKTKDERFKWVWDHFRKFLLCERQESITRQPKHKHPFPEVGEIVFRSNDDDSCYRNWIEYNSYLLDLFFDEIDALPDARGCLDRYIINLSLGIGFTLIRIGSSHTHDIREFIEHLWCIDSALARIDRRSNYNNLPKEIIDIGRRDLRIYCTQAHRAIVALSVKDFDLIGKKGSNGGRPFYIEIDRTERTLTAGGKTERITGKAWDILLYLDELRQRGDGAKRTIDVDDKRADIKNAKDGLRRKFGDYAERIIENRGGLYYLGAGVKVIHGGQVGIKPTKQKAISRKDFKR